MPNPPISQATVHDAAGNTLTVVHNDTGRVDLRCPDGTVVSVPPELLSGQDDGSLRLPFTVHTAHDAATVSIPVVEERLHVGKRSVDTGGVRIEKTVHGHDEQVELALASDQVDIERVAVGAEVEEDNPPRMREEGDTIVIPVLEERLVVRKQLVLKEELRIRRKSTERRVTHTETLRREQVDVVRVEDGKPPG